MFIMMQQAFCHCQCWPCHLTATLLRGLLYWKQIERSQALCNSHDATGLCLPILHHCHQSSSSCLLYSYKLWRFFVHQAPQFSEILWVWSFVSLAQRRAICFCWLWRGQDPLKRQHVCWFCLKSHRSIKRCLRMFHVHCSLWAHTVLMSVEKKKPLNITMVSMLGSFGITRFKWCPKNIDTNKLNSFCHYIIKQCIVPHHKI